MNPWTLKIASLAAMTLAIVVPGAATSRKAQLQNGTAARGSTTQTRIVQNYGRLPLSFEENRGQAAFDVKFVARGTAQTLSLTSQGATLNLRKHKAAISKQRDEDANLVTADVRMTLAAYGASSGVVPVSVVSGKKSFGTVTLSGPAPANLSVTLSSSNLAAASVPGSVTVAAGATTATFNATTFGVAANTAVTISASYGGSTKTAKLTVKPAALASVTLNPKTVKGGNISTGTVKLNGLAPANGATVTLSSSNAAIANVPASVKVNGGATTATFTIGTNAVAANATVTITATYSGKVKSAVLTVTP